MSKLPGIMTQAATYPDNVRMQISAAFACHDEGQLEQAVNYYLAAWDLGLPIDGRYEFYFRFGSALRQTGKMQEAVVIFQRAVEEFPYDKGFPVYLAIALDQAGQSAQAVQELLELLLRLRAQVVDMAKHKPEIVKYLQQTGRDTPVVQEALKSL